MHRRHGVFTFCKSSQSGQSRITFRCRHHLSFTAKSLKRAVHFHRKLKTLQVLKEGGDMPTSGVTLSSMWNIKVQVLAFHTCQDTFSFTDIYFLSDLIWSYKSYLILSLSSWYFLQLKDNLFRQHKRWFASLRLSWRGAFGALRCLGLGSQKLERQNDSTINFTI